MSRSSFENLWLSAPPAEKYFDPAQVSELPEAARRYLRHSIAGGTPLASAGRLRMHGEIKLKGWNKFSAEQIIRWGRGMIWRATVRMHGISIRGGDSFVDGQGAMHWKLFGIVPVINASGPDITRSAAGRVNIESIWLPRTSKVHSDRYFLVLQHKDSMHRVWLDTPNPLLPAISRRAWPASVR